MQIAMDKQEIKAVVKEAIKEIIEEEKMESFLKNIALASKEEMEDISKLYGKPTKERVVALEDELEV